MDHIELPRNVIPIHYDVDITPRLEVLSFKGRIIITVQILEPTPVIVMNSFELEYSSAELQGPVVFPGSFEIDVENQTVSIKFDQAIPLGKYDLAIDYEGK